MREVVAMAAGVLSLMWLVPLNVEAVSPEVEEAQNHGARGMVTLYVADTEGVPVSQAQVIAGFYNPHGGDNRREGRTDGDGVFTAEGTSLSDMNFAIKKEGYYRTSGRYMFYRGRETIVEKGRWEPWNPTIALILKPKKNPVSMFARNVDTTVPVLDEVLGFDFEAGDWVTPRGGGSRVDILLRYSANFQSSLTFAKSLEISFPNDGDGIQRVAADRYSEFISPYSAPTKGYAAEIVFSVERTDRKILKREGLSDEECLVVRVRTVKDLDGRIIRANYAKIYGPFEYGFGKERNGLRFTYYLNANADGTRNLEFDPERNQLAPLRRHQRVWQP